MKKIITIAVILSIFSSCGEQFVSADSTRINEVLEGRADILEPGQVAILYYNYPGSEPKPTLQIQVDTLGKDSFKVTLISSKLHDDSQEAEKIVMSLTRNEGKWKVLDIKKNWRCYKGRGHTGWGIGPCE